MLTQKDYCDYDTCVALKELRFDEKCHGYYEPLKKCFNTTSIKKCWCNSEVDDIGVIICPTLYEAQKWLREEKGMLLQPTYLELSDEWICVLRDKNKRHGYSAQKQKNYEEALSEGIKEAVKLLINNKNE